MHARTQHLRGEYLSVLVDSSSGEPTVYPAIMIPVADVAGSEFEVSGVVSSREPRTFAPTRVHLRELVKICVLWKFVLGVLEEVLLVYSGLVGDVAGRSGTGDVSTELEKDVPGSKMRVEVTRRLIPLDDDRGSLQI